MRLVPRSLFGRLVAVMIVGLAAAQLVGFAIHMHDRRELLAEASGMRAAQRMADIVKLLDSIAPAERERFAAVLASPRMAIRLGESSPMPPAPDAELKARSAIFGAFLRRTLGDERQVEVSVTEAATPPAPWMGPGPANPAALGPRGGMGVGMGMGAGRAGMSVVAQVALRDGTPVRFDTRAPAESQGMPYRILATLAVLLAAVVAVSLLAVRWATRPLATLANAAEALGRDIRRPPLEESGPTEVARAARAFNTMQSRLARFIDDRMRIFAAMSHDLKTPITRLRLRAELLDDAAVRGKFEADLNEMQSMVASTLDFLRGLESGEPVRPVDLAALLESLQHDFAEAGAKVTLETQGLRPYPGRAQAIRRALTNLVENAIKYGGAAHVRARDGVERLEICIRDEGPGIEASQLERVFDPFYRLEPSRNRETGGSGLGLTIARSVARGHGGDVTLRNLPEGGLEATLTLPRSAGR